MGGKAFKAILAPSSVPRLPPAVYKAVKDRFLPSIETLYHYVSVPPEDPEKSTHGDIDYIVACPKNSADTGSINVHHSFVRQALGALHVIPMQGNRTSNFAVKIESEEWAAQDRLKEENEARRLADAEDIFYQIDVNVCANRNEWERVTFFHSYGDMGMILSLVCKTVGLSLGEKGLKYPRPPNSPILLSDNFEEIISFMGMSMDTWKAGFSRKIEVFEWIATSKFFDPEALRSGNKSKKVKEDRKMYHEFVNWSINKLGTEAIAMVPSIQELEHKAREEALDYFGERETLHALARKRKRELEIKDVFNGNKMKSEPDVTGKVESGTCMNEKARKVLKRW